MKTSAWPSLTMRLQGDEQVVDLLRRQHRGRLVQDDQAGAAVQRLDDLDPLLLAHRQLPDVGSRVDLQAVALRQLARCAPRPGRGRAAARARTCRPSATFSATVSVGTSMKCWWIMPIPARIASAGEWKTCGLPSIRISPFVRAGTGRTAGASACSCRRRFRPAARALRRR